MSYEATRVVVSSAARTTTGQSSAITLQSASSKLNVQLDVTAQSGTTPTLDVTVEWSPDGGTTWAKGDGPDAFTQITTTIGTKIKQFLIKAPVYRIVWTIAGTTPSYTFSVSEYLTQ